MKNRIISLLLLLLMLSLPVMGEEEVSLFSPGGTAPAQAETLPSPEPSAVPEPGAEPDLMPEAAVEADPAASSEARDELIDRMIDLAEEIYQKANGRAQPANSPGDIYVCKNFTVHLFRENRDDYRMAAFPDVPLLIPNNLPAKESKPYSYGISWENVAAEKGNPFVIGAQFFYNADESKQENRARAIEFMKQVQRGDFFQMSADYYYGIGAHSLVFTQDYDPDTGTVTWTDSNMKGEKRNGKRYGYVQFDARKDIEWFVDAFCVKGRGATLYRLRDDIIKR